MYRNIRLRIAASLTAATCLLFAQLAVAAYACPLLSSAAAEVPSAQSADLTIHVDDRCAGDGTTRSGLCAAHCNPACGALTHAQCDAPPAMLVSSHPLAALSAPPAGTSATGSFDVVARSHAPPHAILHCCFRI